MSFSVVNRIGEWITTFPKEDSLSMTFHGGEPLVAGVNFFRKALEVIVSARDDIRISVQSNLWLLNDELIDLFKQYGVMLGTSLDGPEAINDRQRGKGYFQRTMKKVAQARQAGLKVGCIATLTKWSARNWRDILAFFETEGMDVSFHAALPHSGMPSQEWVLTPDDYGLVLKEMFDDFLVSKARIRIQPIEAMTAKIISGSNGICVFGDCLGKFFAVDPAGLVYPCQRWIGNPEFSYGSLDAIKTRPLESFTLWQKLAGFRKEAEVECKGCEFWEDCGGGCPYNALSAGKTARDPYCRGYYPVYQHILEEAADEVFSPENMAALVDNPCENGNLLQVGKLKKPA
jgi:uncharacterized protein